MNIKFSKNYLSKTISPMPKKKKKNKINLKRSPKHKTIMTCEVHVPNVLMSRNEKSGYLTNSAFPYVKHDELANISLFSPHSEPSVKQVEACIHSGVYLALT